MASLILTVTMPTTRPSQPSRATSTASAALPATEFSIHLVYSAWKAGRGNVGSRLKRLHPPALGLR